MYLITVSKYAPEDLKQKVLPNYSMSWNNCEMWLRKVVSTDRMWFSITPIK